MFFYLALSNKKRKRTGSYFWTGCPYKSDSDSDSDSSNADLPFLDSDVFVYGLDWFTMNPIRNQSIDKPMPVRMFVST